MFVFNLLDGHDAIWKIRYVNDGSLQACFSQTFVVSLVLVRRRRLLVVNNVGNDAFTLDVASCCARRAGSLLVTALCNSTNYDFRQPFLNSGSVASSD